jgi:chromosome partitioning protein
MHVIAVAQVKGGVAKSTLAIHLAAERTQAGLGKPDVMRQDANQLEQTLNVMRNLGVKVVVLDLPGSSNPAINAAVKLASLVLLPARPQEIDITASAEALAVVQRLRKRYAYVMTFVEGNGARAHQAAESLAAEGHAVAPCHMHRRQEYVDAVIAGRTAAELRPKSKAAEEIAGLWDWISSELEKGHDQQAERHAGRSKLAS